MYIKICILIFLFPSSSAFGQKLDTLSFQQKIIKPVKRNFIWITPTRAKEINGIAIGTLPSSMFYKNDSLHINGILVETNPIMLYFVPYVVIGSLRSPFFKADSSRYFTNLFPDSVRGKSDNHLRGLNLSILGSGEMNHYKGLSISSIVTFGQSMKGVSVTLGQNNFYEFQGVLIAGLLNNVNKGSGLQIGLFNRCKECKGVQIGLLNKMGKKTFPFFNIQL